MHFKELLHPELILNRRGLVEKRQYYQTLLNQLSYYNGGIGMSDSMLAEKDDNFLTHFGMYKKFSVEKPKVFYASQDFLKAVETMDKEIPLDLLPSNFFGYIAFPKNAIKDGFGFNVDGAYVFLGDAKNIGSTRFGPETKLFKVSTTYESRYTGYLNLPISSDEKFSALFSRVPLKDSYTGKRGTEVASTITTADRAPIFRILLNLILYIHAADLELLRPASNAQLSKTQIQKIKAKNGGSINTCTLPITLINFDFHQGRRYSVSGATVKGHFRHQRCGKEWSQYRTIWIDSHDRQYKNSDSEAAEAKTKQSK
jgi:hypothetical protein